MSGDIIPFNSSDKMVEGALPRDPIWQRRLDRINNITYAIINALRLEVYKGEEKNELFLTPEGVLTMALKTLTISAKDIFTLEDIENELQRLFPTFDNNMTNAEIELSTQLRKQLLIMLYLKEFLEAKQADLARKEAWSARRIDPLPQDLGIVSAYYNTKTGRPDWKKIYKDLADYFKRTPQHRNTVISPADIARIFDHKMSPDDFKEKIQSLFDGRPTYPFTLKFESLDSTEMAQDIHDKTVELAKAGYASSSVFEPEKFGKNILVSIASRPNELIHRFFSTKANFFQPTERFKGEDEYPFANSLFAKLMTEICGLHTSGIAIGSIYDTTSLSFMDYDHKDPENAVLRYNDLSKLAYQEGNGEKNSELSFYLGMARDMLGVLKTVHSITQVSLLLPEERKSAIEAIDWYYENVSEYLGKNMKQLNLIKLQFDGRGLNFDEMIVQLKNIINMVES